MARGWRNGSTRPAGSNLFKEHEEHCQHQAHEGGEMIPLDGLPLEDEHHYDSEDRQGNNLLNYLQLQQVEGPAVGLETNPVGGDGKTIFKKRNAP